MKSIRIIFLALSLLTKHFPPVNSMTCDSGALQVCDGPPVNTTAYYKPDAPMPIKLKPILTFINIANVDEHEKTVTVFLSLALGWNDTKVSIKRYG